MDMAVTMILKNVWTQTINYPYIHTFAALNLVEICGSTIVPPHPKLASWDFNVHREATTTTRLYTFGVLFLIANSDSQYCRAT